MVWTRFMDLHRGGEKKLGWDYLYVQAEPAEAIGYVRTQFGIDPLATGDRWYQWDYGLHEYDLLEDAAKQNAAPDESPSGHLSRPDVLVVETPELADEHATPLYSPLNDSNKRRNRGKEERHRDGVRLRR